LYEASEIFAATNKQLDGRESATREWIERHEDTVESMVGELARPSQARRKMQRLTRTAANETNRPLRGATIHTTRRIFRTVFHHQPRSERK